MQRILIIGCCGAGKSTFALKLSSILNIDVIHLDTHYWKPSWIEPARTDWKLKVSDLCQGDSWIMDGNYGGTLESRIKMADTIFFLNFPTLFCLFYVFKRIITKTRPDVIQGCKERFNWEFLKFVLLFNKNSAPKIHSLLSVYRFQRDIFIFKSRHELHAYIHALEKLIHQR